MSTADETRVRNALVREIQSQGAQTAAKIVQVVAEKESVPVSDVARQVRILVERGLILVGPDLNLVANDAKRAAG